MTGAIDPHTATGLSPRVAATLAYSAWWLTGFLFLVLERRNRYVRFHAAQALVGLGALTLVLAALAALSLLLLTVSYSAMWVAGYAVPVVWLLGMLVWMACMYQAARGRWWALPVAGAWARRLIA